MRSSRPAAADAVAAPFTSDEIAALRAATPGVDNVVHFNHAGSSLPTATTLDTQLDHLRLEAERGGYEAAALAAEREEAVYDSIASLIGGQRHEIARMEHATAAWSAAFWSLPMRSGQRILTAEAEYGANAIAFMRAAERHGVTIDVVPSDDTGALDLNALDNRLDSDVAVVAITHVPTNGGLVNPAAEVGRRTRELGVPFLLDACQSVGHLDLDVAEIGCDLLSATGRKYLRGPRGSGFLWVSESLFDRVVADHPDHHGSMWVTPDHVEQRPDARRFEWWEYNHAAWLGLGAAVDQLIELDPARVEATIRLRADQLRSSLKAIGINHRDLGPDPCGIVTAAIPGVDAHIVKRRLGEQDINVSVPKPSSTWWDSARRELPDLLRMSVHAITTADEISALTDAIATL